MKREKILYIIYLLLETPEEIFLRAGAGCPLFAKCWRHTSIAKIKINEINNCSNKKEIKVEINNYLENFKCCVHLIRASLEALVVEL